MEFVRSRSRQPSRSFSTSCPHPGVQDAGHARFGGQDGQRLVAERVDARPFASDCAITTCRRLTRSGIPPPENVVPSGSIASRSAR